jgi:hypothetical protein
MTPAGSVTTNANVEASVAGLEAIMDRLEQTIAEETAQVRAGRLSKAFDLENAKIECARLYVMESERLKTSKGALAPAALDRLRRRHDTFQNMLRMNLTVLATAHAVSEGIIRGVSGELARKQAPSTYSASGRAQAPSTKTSPPLAFSRSL